MLLPLKKFQAGKGDKAMKRQKLYVIVLALLLVAAALAAPTASVAAQGGSCTPNQNCFPTPVPQPVSVDNEGFNNANQVAPGPAPTYRWTASSGNSYVVKAGDTLTALAIRFHVSVGAIMQLNNLSNQDFIYIGQILQIPNSNSGSTTTFNTSNGSVMATATPVYVPQPVNGDWYYPWGSLHLNDASYFDVVLVSGFSVAKEVSPTALGYMTIAGTVYGIYEFTQNPYVQEAWGQTISDLLVWANMVSASTAVQTVEEAPAVPTMSPYPREECNAFLHLVGGVGNVGYIPLFGSVRNALNFLIVTCGCTVNDTPQGTFVSCPEW